MILSFQTDMPGQTQIRLLLEVYTVWTHYSMVEPHSSNFRVITTNFLGVHIFRKFTVDKVLGLTLQINVAGDAFSRRIIVVHAYKRALSRENLTSGFATR